MPNRILRDAILTSEAVSTLAWPDEVFYRRLMSIVDDYGRCEANPQLLRSRCYPLQTDQVRVADISRWMAACQKAGLIALYDVAGKSYLQIEKFGQQQRSASKCPEPPSVASNCSQAPANEHLGVFVFGGVVEGGDEGGKRARKRTPPPDCPGDVDEQVWKDWLSLRKDKRAPVTATVVDGARSEAGKAGMPLEAFLRIWCRRGSQGLEAAWLKPDERSSGAIPLWKAEQNARMAEFAGPAAAKPATQPMEVFDVTARIVG